MLPIKFQLNPTYYDGGHVENVKSWQMDGQQAMALADLEQSSRWANNHT